MKLVADINIPFLRGALEPWFTQVEYLPGNAITHDVVRDADALLVRTRTLCNAELLTGSRVKFIGSATIGHDHIDTNYCTRNGITWANAPGCNSGGVLQWVVAALFRYSEAKQTELAGKTLGVVGVGNVGRKVVLAAKALGLKVLCCDPPRQSTEGLPDFVDLATIARESDIITFHVPLLTGGEYPTFHMADDQFFSKLKPGVFIINSSRGEVVNTTSLAEAIGRRVNAAALDVWENEPSISNMLLEKALIATPHIAGYSLEGKVTGTCMVVDALSDFFDLGIRPWRPAPNPLAEKIHIHHTSLDSLVMRTYNIMDDDSRLRENPFNFERLRNEYKYRRDFSGYVVNGYYGNGESLEMLGFNLSR
jgi:erythronate-4-phosphate dehydrogenase